MKKLNILLSLALVAGISSCDDDVIEPMPPQSNPQETIMSADGLTVAAELPAELSLQTYKDNGSQVPVLKITELKDAPENSKVAIEMQVSATDDFASVKTIETTVTDNVAYVDYQAWDDVQHAMFGNTPRANTVYVRFAAYLVDNRTESGNTKVRLGGADVYYAAASIVVTPVDLGITVDAKYYLLTDVYFDNWPNSLVEFTHDNESTDLIANPTFTYTGSFDAGQQLQIMGSSDVDKANADAGNEYLYVWGPQSDNSTSGELVYGEDAKFINIKDAGTYSIKINMLERTFSVERIYPAMYMIGGFCDWKWANAVQMVQGNDNTDLAGKYWSLVYVEAGSGFKFNTKADWGGDFGFAGATCKSYVDGVTFSADKDGNICVDKSGWYLFGVEKAEGANGDFEYTVNVFPPTVYVYGDCNGGTWSDSAEWTFTVPTTADGDFVSPALASDGKLRLCVHPMVDATTQWIGDWWKSEFIFFDGVITYRETGSDQAAVEVKAGQVVHLNFKTGKASLQ